MKKSALQNNRVGVLRVAFRARKVLGAFKKRAPGLEIGINKDPISIIWNIKQILTQM